MANSMFNPAREGFLAGEIDWDTAVIKGALVRGYTYNAAHKFVSDITGAGGTLHAISAAFAGKSITNGTADANDVTWSSVASNATNHYVLIYQASAVTGGADVATSAQRVIAWIDTGTNIPVQPNGGNVTVAWDNGTNKIFTL
jgi:hypothetical protein